MKLIGLMGKARSGKDTVGDHLWVEHDFVKLSFATPLKAAAMTIFGMTNHETYSDELKETVMPYWGFTPRQIFQILGTECIRNQFGGDVWVKRLAMSYNIVKDTDNVVITDVRFQEEYDWVVSQGGVIVEIVRDGAGLAGVEGAHASERGIAMPADYVIHNNSTIEALQAEIDLLVSKL